ncbi:MAG: Co2+/Mg2+ efflux protein ApaG [Vicingaceae bacterium]
MRSLKISNIVYRKSLIAMEIAVTDGIKIAVSTKFEEGLSSPCKCLYYFSYQIRIENNSGHAVQLLKRKWMIFDSIGEHLLVEGEGVVGKKPVIENAGHYQYESACKLNSGVGKMWGIYYMKRLSDGADICVKIPEFQLIVPFRLN